MALTFTTEIAGKPKKFFLHRYGSRYLFSKEPQGALDEIPQGYEVKSMKNGLLYLKKVN